MYELAIFIAFVLILFLMYKNKPLSNFSKDMIKASSNIFVFGLIMVIVSLVGTPPTFEEFGYSLLTWGAIIMIITIVIDVVLIMRGYDPASIDDVSSIMDENDQNNQ